MFSGSQVQEEIQKSRLLLAKTQRLRQSSAVFRTQMQSSQCKASQFRSVAQNQQKAADKRIEDLRKRAAEYYIAKHDGSRCNDRLLLADALSALKMAKYRALYDLGTALEACAPQQHENNETQLMQQQRQVLLHRAQELQNRLQNAIDRLKSAASAEELVDSHCELVEIQFQRQMSESAQEDPWAQPQQQIAEAFQQANRLPMSLTGLTAACLSNFDEARDLFEAVLAEVETQIRDDTIMQLLCAFLRAGVKSAACLAYTECAERCGTADSWTLENDILRYINTNLALSVDQSLLREQLLLMQLGGVVMDEKARELLAQTPSESQFDANCFCTYLLAYEVVANPDEYLAGKTAQRSAQLHREQAGTLQKQLLACCAAADNKSKGQSASKDSFKERGAAFLSQQDAGGRSLADVHLKTEIMHHIADISAELLALNLFCLQRSSFYRICARNQRLQVPAGCFPAPFALQANKIPLQREIDARERIRRGEEAKEQEFRAATRDLLQAVGELVKVEDALSATTIPGDALIAKFGENGRLGRLAQEFRAAVFKDEDLHAVAYNLRVISSKNIETEMSDFGRFRTACVEQFKAEAAQSAEELRTGVVEGLREVYERPELQESEILQLGEICQLISR